MNLYHLKYFYDSARFHSITKAASLNLVGQPAISKGIQSLEAAFKKGLISHERNRFKLTEEGELVFSYCEKIFSITNELNDSLASEVEPAGEVRFACPSSLAESELVSSVIDSIHKKYPKISLKLMLGRTDLICDWLREGLVDFVISLDNVDLTGFQGESLYRGHHYLIKSKNCSKAWQREGIFTVENKSEVLELRKRYQVCMKKSLVVKMEIGSWTVIKRFVLRGMGVGFVPDYMIRKEIKSRLISLVESKKLAIPYQIQLVRKADGYLPKRCQVVVSEFKEASGMNF